MKKPKYAAITMQEQTDVGINPFAVTLLAESFADDPERFGDETMMVIGHAHNGTEVYILMSTRPPEPAQFDKWPET